MTRFVVLTRFHEQDGASRMAQKLGQQQQEELEEEHRKPAVGRGAARKSRTQHTETSRAIEHAAHAGTALFLPVPPRGCQLHRTIQPEWMTDERTICTIKSCEPRLRDAYTLV